MSLIGGPHGQIDLWTRIGVMNGTVPAGRLTAEAQARYFGTVGAAPVNGNNDYEPFDYSGDLGDPKVDAYPDDRNAALYAAALTEAAMRAAGELYVPSPEAMYALPSAPVSPAAPRVGALAVAAPNTVA